MRIKDVNDCDIVEQLLKAKEYFNVKNILADLVILNEEKNIYEQYVKEKIQAEILNKHLEHSVNKYNGIFILNANEISKHDVNLLIFRSNVLIDASKGNVKSQLEEQEEEYLEKTKQIGVENPNIVLSKEDNYNPINLKVEDLNYYNEYGGFNKNTNEYVLKIGRRDKLPTVWSHMLVNPNFGTVVTENMGGFTWCDNSRLNRITAWNNSPNQDIPSEIVYIKDKETGKVWSTSSFITEESDCEVTYGFGYAKYTNICNDIVANTEIFVPQDANIKVNILKLKNTIASKRNLKLIYYVKPCLDEDETKSNGYINIWKQDNIIYAKNQSSNNFAKIAYVGTNKNIISYTGNKKFFIGNKTIKNPEGVNKVSLDNAGSLGKNACIALEINIELDGFESKELTLFIGEEEQEERIQEISNKYSNLDYCYEQLKQTKQYWYELINRVQIKTPVESMNIMLNGWMVYQTICSRIWGKTGYYQSGGATGFRDQLQDTLGLKYIDIEFMKKQIIDSASHQFVEGDVLHWWHNQTKRGIRTRFSDDLLWLPYVVCEYLEFTDNYNILEEQVPYLYGEPLKEGEDERYEMYLPSETIGSIYEHCNKAIGKSLDFGEHNLPKIGSGDWNDGFSTVGNKGKRTKCVVRIFLIFNFRKIYTNM